MAGQVKHVKIFSGIVPDLTLLSVLRRLQGEEHRRADLPPSPTCCADHGIELIDSTELLSRCWPGPAC